VERARSHHVESNGRRAPTIAADVSMPADVRPEIGAAGHRADHRWPTDLLPTRRGRPFRPADDARPRQPVLLPGGGRRAVHGRLRARPGAVVARWRAAGLQPPPPGPRLAPLRIDHGGRDPAGPRDRRRRRDPDDQRPRGLHPRQRVHPRRERGRGFSSRPASAPTASPVPAGSASSSRSGS
jgi:hypothetical protein